jgi:transcriptional regulator with XRE-family HTH domain
MAKTGEDDEVEARVRERLRRMRNERGLTLAEVAQRARMDVSTLSRLEAGKRRLALHHVPVLAAALGVSTSALLEVETPADPRVHSEPLRLQGLTLWPLTQHGAAAGLHAYKILVDAARNRPPTPLPTHDGRDWLYVLSGKLRLILDDSDFIIEPGEAVEFATWTPHWFGAVDGPVELLAVFGPHGERLHLHE